MSPADTSPFAGAGAVTCPECGRSASGNFCSHCGASLGGRFCDQCGAEAPPGARFCNQCGAAVRGVQGGGPSGTAAAAGGAAGPGAGGTGPPRRGGARSAPATEPQEPPRALVTDRNLAWWLLGVAMFVLIVVLGVSMVEPGGPPAPAAVSAPRASPGGNPPDLSSMTPIEAATRLFNRVMAAAESGDSTEARAFLPMAIAAYDRARPLDHDGLYHLSVLQNAAGQLDAALDNATLILDEDPDHLLGLLAAARAADEIGFDQEARGHYEHLLEVYDDQMARALQEYQDHAGTVSTARAEAQAYLAAR